MAKRELHQRRFFWLSRTQIRPGLRKDLVHHMCFIMLPYVNLALCCKKTQLLTGQHGCT